VARNGSRLFVGSHILGKGKLLLPDLDLRDQDKHAGQCEETKSLKHEQKNCSTELHLTTGDRDIKLFRHF
jgi:hypothetical protein